MAPCRPVEHGSDRLAALENSPHRSMARKEALEVDRLTVTFAREGRTVVRNVSFTIASGEA
jgi:hypothetical protein